MTQAFNLSQFANNVNSAGVAQTGGGGTGTNIASNDLTVNGLTVGKGGGALSSNTALGVNSLVNNTSGSANSAFANNALGLNTTGNYNSAFGGTDGVIQSALGKNTTGSNNAAFGNGALASNTTGNFNFGGGFQALANNTTASNNTAVGYQSGYSTTTAGLNTFIGKAAGYTNITGTANTYIGTNAGNAATSSSNTLIGYGAGSALTTGGSNTFIGGLNSAQNISSGGAMTTGSNNTIVGNYTGNMGGLDIRTASNYIVLSDGDGNPRYWIDSNGYAALNVGSTRGQFSIGFNGNVTNGMSILTTSSAVGESYINFLNNGAGTAGSISHTGGTTVSYNTTSDYRLKENIAPMTGALAKISQLKPVTYTWKADGSDGQGFIAHELQAVIPDCVTGKKDAVDADGNPVYQGIDTSFLVATLTAAIQELKAEFDAYKATHP